MTSRRQLCYLLTCAAAFVYLNLSGHLGPSVVTAHALTQPCDEVCGPTTDCDTPCLGTYVEEPQNTTCGDHLGGAAGGQCAGDCGDAYCNSANGEDADTCYSDCGVCGDNVCSDIENTICPQDCRECGDGLCAGGETCGNCAEDCNPTNDECSSAEEADEVGSDDGCPNDPFEVRNGAGYCCAVAWYLDPYDVYMDGGPNSACAEVCNEYQQCIEILPLFGGGGGIGWGCVGLGETCGGNS